MPVEFLSDVQVAAYGRFTGELSAGELERFFYLDDADRDLVARRRPDHHRLGFAVQLGTVRAVGRFLEDPLDVPWLAVELLADELEIGDASCVKKYVQRPQTPYEHAWEIRDRYGYRSFDDQGCAEAFARFLDGRAWTHAEGPVALDDRTVQDHVGKALVFGPFQRLAQAWGLSGEHRDDLLQVPVGGGPRDAVIAGQGVGGGAVAEPPQPQDRLLEAGQRPAALRRPAPAAPGRQQRRGELGQFPAPAHIRTTSGGNPAAFRPPTPLAVPLLVMPRNPEDAACAHLVLLRLVASSACVRTVRSNALAPSSVKEIGHGERQSPGGAMRRSANAMAAAVLVSLLAGGCSSAVVAAHHARAAAGERRPSSPTARAAAVTDAGLPRCAARSLALGLGPFVSPMTGEEATLYTLTNLGSGTCTLRGYPRVVFYDASGARLPFRYARGGGEYVTAARPVTVVLARGAWAYVLVAKYRCDIGIARSAAAMWLTLPAAHGATFAGRQPTGLPYCRGGRQDPGQTITVSPVEPTPRATSSAP
jgi:hypothetical protein